MLVVNVILLLSLYGNGVHACKSSNEPVPPGQPYIANCMPTIESALEQYFVRRNGFTLPILWNETKDAEDVDPYDFYRISVQAFRWKNIDDYRNNRPRVAFDISAFMTRDEKEIHIRSFRAPPGIYLLEMFANPCRWYENRIKSIKQSCYYYIKPLPPLVVLEGGFYRTVPENQAVILHAEDSMDLDEPLNEFNLHSLSFKWTCTAKASLFCVDEVVGEEVFLVIPQQYVAAGETYNVSLQVTSARSVSSWAYQVIDVQNNSAMLTLTCMKNCPPATDAPNVQSNTFIQASCVSNCLGVQEESFVWEITASDDSSFSFNYDSDTEFGRNGPKFIIKRNVLKAGTDYQISVKMPTGSRGEARMIVNYAVIPIVDSCEIVPPSGVSLQTWFTLNCVEAPPPDKNNFYKLFLDEEMQEYVVNGYYPDVFRIKFLLPPSKGRKFTVRIAKGSGPAIFLPVHPNVKSASQGKTLQEALDIYNKFINGSRGLSVPKLVLSDDPKLKQKGIKMFQALVNEVVANEATDTMHEFAKNMTYSIVEELLKSPPKDAQELLTLSDSISKILDYHNLTQEDPILAKFASTICAKMVEAHADEIKKQKFPLNSEAQFNTVGKVLTKCMEANVRENFDIIRPVTFNITVSDISPSPDGEPLFESYPNYVDYDEMYGKHMDNLNEVTSTVIDSTAKAAKSIALTTASGEHFARTSGKYSATLVAKDVGDNLARTKIQLLDVALIPSHDFDRHDHHFDIIMSTWSKDIMWWNPKHTRIMTNILSTQFWHSNCKKRIRHFRAPVSLLMNMTGSRQFNETVIKSNVSVPGGYALMSGEELNPYIRIHRIGIFAGSVLHIKFRRRSFLNLFDVVLTKFELPSSKNFVVNETINDRDYNHYLRIINYESYDIWGYLGILPSKRHIWHNRSRLMSYQVTFLSSYCILWHRNDKVWKPSCKPGLATTLEVINCDCLHFSVLAGYLQNAESLIQEVLSIDILLSLDSCHVIFTTVAITLGLYCLLLIPVASRKQPPVYYLCDNDKDDLYAYLVIVRTENKRNAGTTSNVMIRINGTKAASKAHVLNYPDPELRLLQKQGEDMFVLTTSQHLGKLQGLEIWFDCTGPNPSWYCRDIVIYDMQKKQDWYFRIKTNFNITQDVTYLTMLPTEFVDTRRISSRLRICNHFHTWELWAMEKNFSFPARLTVIFSNILMMYCIVLTRMHIPTMELRDVFDCYDKFYIPSEAITIMLHASVMSFIVHVIIAWVFRFSSSIDFYVCKKKVRNNRNFGIFCWILLAVLIGCSMSFLILFGFWVPLYTSLVWLVCSLMAIVFEVLVLENLFILVQAFVCNFRLAISFHRRIDKILKFVENERLELHTKFGNTLLRPYLTHLYKPLKTIQVIKRRIVDNLRLSIYNDLEDLIMYGIYNIILYMIILVNKGEFTTHSRAEVISLIEGKHTRTLAFSKIESVPEVYQYINETLIPTMQPTTWYENFSISGAGLMADNANKYIGIARLRQHRMSTTAGCVIPELLRFLNTTCWPEFTLGSAEDETFGYQWGQFQSSDEYDRMKNIYYYQTEKETESYFSFGRIASYTGGGYVAYLGRHLYNSYANFRKLWTGFWLDHKTRAIFIEFLVYNANYNVFVAVSLLYEYSAAGFAVKTIQVDVVRMLFVQSEIEVVTMILFIIYCTWLALLALKLLVVIFKNLGTFYKKVWIMIDLIILVMSVSTISMFVLRMRMVGSYLETLEGVKHNAFVSYFGLLAAETFLTIFSSLLVGIATVRLWKFLRFGQFFRILERTLSIAAFPLFAISLAFAAVLTGFGFAGILIYGNEYPELSTFIKIVATLIQMALKPDQFDLGDYLDFQISYWYFSLYLVFMQVILLLYVTVIIMAYVKAQLEFSVLPDSYTVGDYLRERVEYFPRIIKTKLHRLRAGDEAKEVVTPKADEFRFANCVGIQTSSIKSMRFIVSCIIRNMNESEAQRGLLTEYEVQLMLGVCRSFVLRSREEDSVELFFKGHFEGERVHLVDEKRITKVADFTKLMFGEQLGEASTVGVEANIVRCVQMIRRKGVVLNTCFLQLKLMAFRLDAIDELLSGWGDD